MRGRMASTRRVRVAATAAIALVSLAVGAAAAAPTDPGFGTGGLVTVAPPAESTSLGRPVLPGVSDLAEASDGDLVAALGGFGSARYFGSTRFTREGALDTGYGTDGFAHAHSLPNGRAPELLQAEAVAVDHEGRALVAGYRDNEVGGTAPLLARFLADGSPDPSFGSAGFVTRRPASEGTDPLFPREGGGQLHDVAVARGGVIVAVGGINEVHGGDPAGLVVAFRADGKLDSRFGHGGRVVFPARRRFRFTSLRAVTVLRDGSILVAGYRFGRLFLARLRQSGRLDRRFGGGDGEVAVRINREEGRLCCLERAALAVQADGRILVAAESDREQLALVRLLPDGRPDRGFGRNGALATKVGARLKHVYGLVARKGRIDVVGEGPSFSGAATFLPRGAVLQLHPDGSLDRGFGRDGLQTIALGEDAFATTALARPSGRLVVGGTALTDGGRRSNLFLAGYR
jgi:uncharacterized delta-60 repeat protein